MDSQASFITQVRKVTMRILISLFVGIPIGYLAFSPDMGSIRQDGWAKISGMIGGK